MTTDCPACGRRRQDTPINTLTAWTGTTCPPCIARALQAPTAAGNQTKRCAACGTTGNGVGKSTTHPGLCHGCEDAGIRAQTLF